MARSLAHLDAFTLLRLAGDDVDDIERATARRHLGTCAACRHELATMQELDQALRTIGKRLADKGPEEFTPNDPFARRPSPTPRPSATGWGIAGLDLVSLLRDAADQATPKKDELLAAAISDAATACLAALDLASLRDRYALGFALDDACLRMAEGPRRWEGFASAVAKRLAGDAPRSSLAEYAYPLVDLRARAALLAGFSRNWTGEYERGGEDLARAYALFARGLGTERSFAIVELHESQRRSFLDQPAPALVLARRAKDTLASYGFVEDAARAQFAEGLALAGLDRNEEAIIAFRATLPVFAGAERWNAYVSVLNNIASSLLFLGRLDEARREYARALRHVSATQRPAVHAFVRYNLALLYVRAKRYADAIPGLATATTLFARQGAWADAYTSTLYHIECLARTGKTADAKSLLATLERDLATHDLDPSTLAGIRQALESDAFPRLTELRDQAEAFLRARFKTG